MLNLWVVGLLVVVLLRDSIGAPASGAAASTAAATAAPWVWIAGLVPLATIALLVQLVMIAVGRTVDRSGSVRALIVAERTLLASRFLMLLVHAGNVLVLGWLTEARRAIGDVVLLDELLCVLPALGVLVAGWWSAYPVERRVREASMLRQIDQSRPVYAVPSRWQYIAMAARHQLSLSLIPIALISSWRELSERILYWAETAGPAQVAVWLTDPVHAGSVRVAAQLIGVAGVLAIAPLIVRLMWETSPLSEGPLRSRLSAMCARHGVRVRDILVWRTGGSMINGAVVGMFGRLRYVLLTDALLDAMPRPQVEAVMAHEVAHARCSHMPWLAAVLLATVGCTAAAGSLAASAAFDAMIANGMIEVTADAVRAINGVQHPVHQEPQAASTSAILAATGLEAAVTVTALLSGLFAFGLVSRRFEWQADAFAAKALSLQPVRGSVLRMSDESSTPSADDASRAPISADSAAAAYERGLDAIDGTSNDGETDTLTPDLADVPTQPIVHRAAVDAMAGALQSVATLNFIPRHRKSFRHGSIAQRQQRLRSLVGQRLDDLPIDRTVRWIKRTAVLGLFMLIALAIWGG